MPDFSAQISDARKNGHSDDDILGYLASRPDLSDKIKQARASGYGSSDILGYLGGQPSTSASPAPPLPGELQGPIKPGLLDSMKSALTTGSPLNPMNWPGMISSAFESPFSDANMAEGQRQANLVTGKTKPTPIYTSDIPGMLGEGVGQAINAGLMYGAGEGLSALPGSRVAAGASGAAKGAWRGATEMAPVSHGLLPRLLGVPDVNMPAVFTRGAQGATAGEFVAGKTGAVLGGTMGAVAPIAKGAYEGGKQAIKMYDIQNAPMRQPLTATPSTTLPPMDIPVDAAPITPVRSPRAVAQPPAPVARQPLTATPSSVLPSLGTPVDAPPVTPIWTPRTPTYIPDPAKIAAEAKPRSVFDLTKPGKQPVTPVANVKAIAPADDTPIAPAAQAIAPIAADITAAPSITPLAPAQPPTLHAVPINTPAELPDAIGQRYAEVGGKHADIRAINTHTKNADIAQHLNSLGVKDVSDLSDADLNTLIKEVNAKTGNNYKPMGSGSKGKGEGRTSEQQRADLNLYLQHMRGELK